MRNNMVLHLNEILISFFSIQWKKWGEEASQRHQSYLMVFVVLNTIILFWSFFQDKEPMRPISSITTFLVQVPPLQRCGISTKEGCGCCSCFGGHDDEEEGEGEGRGRMEGTRRAGREEKGVNSKWNLRVLQQMKGSTTGVAQCGINPFSDRRELSLPKTVIKIETFRLFRFVTNFSLFLCLHSSAQEHKEEDHFLHSFSPIYKVWFVVTHNRLSKSLIFVVVVTSSPDHDWRSANKEE